jgi:radical SAM superfamily enzyme YgiQ (UPF0313 family)
MRILLLQPNYDTHIVHPPLGLGYLAAFLRSKGHQVSIYDGTLENASTEGFLKAIAVFKPRLVGISVLTRGHFQAKTIVQTVKERFKGIAVVIGGTQVTAAPVEVLTDLGADFAVIGEGEMTLAELAKELGEKSHRFKEIQGLAYKFKGKVKINKPRELFKDLDSLPFPAWDLMPPARYRIAPILEPARAFPIAPIMTSRGCPYQCSFCASGVTWGRKIRFRSPENILAEIKMLKEEFGVKEIHFADDNFTMDIERAEKVCDRLIAEKINLPWQCPNGVRIDRLTLPLIKKMKKAGCYAVGLGIESGNQEILRRANKNLDLRIVPRILRNLKKVGIETYGFFIFGLPGETKKTIKETISFALKNTFDRVWFNLFTPYPGSPVFPEWLGKRKFNQINWNEHDCSTAVVEVKGLSLKELEKWQKKALFQFYSRPKVLLKLVAGIGPREMVSFLRSRFFNKFSGTLFNFIHELR